MEDINFWGIIYDLEDKFKLKIKSGIDGKRYVRFKLNDVKYAIPMDSKLIIPMLKYMIDSCRWGTVNRLQIKELKELLLGSALLSPDIPVNIYRRVASKKSDVAVLLNQASGLVVSINKYGVEPGNKGQFTFYYSDNANSLPVPEQCSDTTEVIKKFRVLTGLSKQHFTNLIVCLLRGLTSTGPYPIVGVTGDPGLASMLGFMIKSIIDPTKGHTRSIPTKESDLTASMGNDHVIAYNATFIPPKILNAICNHADGSAAAKSLGRADDDESVFWACRFFVLIGDVNLTYNYDLARRLVLLEAGGDKTQPSMREGEIREQFDELLPKLLWILYSAISYGLKNMNNFKLSWLQKAPDNLVLAVASTDYFEWPARWVQNKLEENQREVSFLHADSDIIVPAIVSLMEHKKSIECTPTELFEKIQDHLKETDNTIALKSFPADPAALGKRLRKAEEALRVYGIECVCSHPHGPRMILLHKIEGWHSANAVFPVAPSRP